MKNNRSVCIFCKRSETSFKSKEHIIPESLGNKEHILPPGVVCDGCNNYFSMRLEGPILNDEFFKAARFRMSIPNKDKRIPPVIGFHYPGNVLIQMFKEKDGSKSFGAFRQRDEKTLVDSLKKNPIGKFVFPFEYPKPDPNLMARFLGKMSLEALALRQLNSRTDFKEGVLMKGLDGLREFVRFGRSSQSWLFYERKLYPENFIFRADPDEHYEVLHEYNFLYTKSKELYFAFVCFGIEYTINMGGYYVDGYKKWLDKNNYASPFYPPDEKEVIPHFF